MDLGLLTGEDSNDEFEDELDIVVDDEAGRFPILPVACVCACACGLFTGEDDGVLFTNGFCIDGYRSFTEVAGNSGENKEKYTKNNRVIRTSNQNLSL